MKKIMMGSVLVTFSFLMLSFVYSHKNVSSNQTDVLKNNEIASQRVTLKLKGTGSKGITVKVGVGQKVGGCERGCYKTIGPNTTVSVQAVVGDYIWDANRKTAIVKVSSGMDGEIIDLKNFY